MERITSIPFLKKATKNKFYKPLFALAIMLFFFAIFDTLLSYILPILLTERGLSKTEMGLILGSSSIAGAFFDLVLSRILKNTDFRKMFLLMIAGCAGYFVILFGAHSPFMYLVAMAMWGLYWNFLSYGLFNFVGSRPAEEHVISWGILDIFKGLGLIVAPIIASLTIGEVVGPVIFGVSLFFLFAVYVFYVVLVKSSHVPKAEMPKLKKVGNIKTFLRVGRILLPVLLFETTLCVFDLSFATIGPLISESLKESHSLGGLFLTLYYLPSILVLWIAGPLTAKYGKKRVGYICFSLGALSLGLFIPFGGTLIILPIVFFSSSVSSLAWPSLKGAFADYIGESKQYEREIEILNDFFGNIGCVIGPMLAGLFADMFGDIRALSFIGVGCGIFVALLWKVTPHKIHVQ